MIDEVTFDEFPKLTLIEKIRIWIKFHKTHKRVSIWIKRK